MEKARSLLEAESNLDEMEDEARERALSYPQRPHAPSPSGVVPAGTALAGSHLGASADPGARQARAGTSESGVFAGISGGGSSGGATGDRLVDSLQGALGAASRNEASLGSLQRAIRDASRAFTASRQAQEALTDELRVMHRGLNELMSEKAAVERYAALLTQERDAALDAAEEARREAKREREFLLREQDRFIQLLLEEHEAELQQLRRTLTQTRSSAAGAEAVKADVPPVTVPGLAPTALDQPVYEGRHSTPPGELGERRSSPPGEFGERRSTPPGEPIEGRRSSPPGELSERRSSPPGELSGAALARQALANTGSEPVRAVPLPSDHSPAPTEVDERSPTYPPAPAVLDLESLAAEVDGNSERPPPIRRLGVAEPVLHLKPARVPTQLFDTLVSQPGEVDPNRKG
ncbi:MAG TPA: hypothetical protein VMG12_12365 [Polyangiaceae bacterium]|nr:hypothetical protein [Polyangiaceae bacterium]